MSTTKWKWRSLADIFDEGVDGELLSRDTSQPGGLGWVPNPKFDIKSGTNTSLPSTSGTVTFITPFESIPNVTITVIGSNFINVWLTEVTKTYFKWSNNNLIGNVTIHWIATNIGNR